MDGEAIHALMAQFIAQVHAMGYSDRQIEELLFHGFCDFAARTLPDEATPAEDADYALRVIAGFAVERFNASILPDGRLALPYLDQADA